MAKTVTKAVVSKVQGEGQWRRQWQRQWHRKYKAKGSGEDSGKGSGIESTRRRAVAKTVAQRQWSDGLRVAEQRPDRARALLHQLLDVHLPNQRDDTQVEWTRLHHLINWETEMSQKKRWHSGGVDRVASSLWSGNRNV